MIHQNDWLLFLYSNHIHIHIHIHKVNYDLLIKYHENDLIHALEKLHHK